MYMWMHTTMKVDILSGDHWASDNVSYRQQCYPACITSKTFTCAIGAQCTIEFSPKSQGKLKASYVCLCKPLEGHRGMVSAPTQNVTKHTFRISLQVSLNIVFQKRYISTIHSVECMYYTQKKEESDCTYYPSDVVSGYELMMYWYLFFIFYF